jgi:hypothetical protein
VIRTDQPPRRPEAEPGSRAVGMTLRMRRIQRGFTLRRCAERMGMSMTDLSAVEQGARVFTPEERTRFEEVVA